MDAERKAARYMVRRIAGSKDAAQDAIQVFSATSHDRPPSLMRLYSHSSSTSSPSHVDEVHNSHSSSTFAIDQNQNGMDCEPDQNQSGTIAYHLVEMHHNGYMIGTREIEQHDQRYIVLNGDDILQRQEEDIAMVLGVLSVSREYAFILLRHFKWDPSKVSDEWFTNEEYVRKAVGLLETPFQMPIYREIYCGICSKDSSSIELSAAACGHPYCFACWQGYMGASIKNGPGCLDLRCPEPSCSVAIPQNMIKNLAEDEDKEKYARYFLTSYVEGNMKTKWCPSPDCDFAVEFLIGSSTNYDVTCSCSFAFCWNCNAEAHRPVDCNVVTMWFLENIAGSEIMNRVLNNSKPCPMCKRPIENYQDLMKVTCDPPCKFEFCRLCLGTWAEHGREPGGVYGYACKRNGSSKKQGVNVEAMVYSYTYFYERWSSNELSRMNALQNLHEMKTITIAQLSRVIGEPETHLNFIIEAWRQIVECRRALKWTYPYGYYIPENEATKRQLFEHLQGEAEYGLERLHECTKIELDRFLNIEEPIEFIECIRKDFSAFQVKLTSLTSVTRNYFEYLVFVLENGLEDINPTVSNSH